MKRLLLLPPLLLGALVAFDLLAPGTSARALIGLERARAGLTAKRIRVDDFDVAYLEGGAGAPLVLIHGFGADKDNFTRVAAYLTPHHRVLVPDLPGFGDSSRRDGTTYAIAAQAERVRAFARAVGLGRVHLGGNSMGGFIATEYALAHPDEVASLWLLAPAGTRVGFDSELTRHLAASGENRLVARNAVEFAQTMEFVMARPPFVPYSVRRLMGERAAADYPFHLRIFDEVGPSRPTLDERLRGLATPALVVWGTADRALNPQAAAVYAAAMPNARTVSMDGIGHLPMLEAPAETAAAYLAFRAALDAQAAR